MRYTGGPPTTRDRINDWLAPRGGPVVDGIRLAAINTVGLVLALAIVGIVSLLTRLLDAILPLPFIFTGFVTIMLLVVAALWFWYRYAEAYARAVRVRARSVRPDVYGAIAALPFVLLALVLVSVGLFSLFLAVITFSLSRAIDAFQQIIFAALFVGLALANVIVARAASD